MSIEMTFDNVGPEGIPPRRGGGGGRRSAILESIRSNLSGPNTVCHITVRPEPGESMSKSINRVTSKLYRKGALDFDFSIRTNASAGQDASGEFGRVSVYRS